MGKISKIRTIQYTQGEVFSNEIPKKLVKGVENFVADDPVTAKTTKIITN